MADCAPVVEQFAQEPPPGWPAAAPCALIGQRRAAVLVRDLARLPVLAKGMRAAAQLADGERLTRAAARARHRRDTAAGPPRFGFRIRPARCENAEQRRIRVRDELLLAGSNPTAWPNATLALMALELRGRGAAAADWRGGRSTVSPPARRPRRGRERPPADVVPTHHNHGTTRNDPRPHSPHAAARRDRDEPKPMRVCAAAHLREPGSNVPVCGLLYGRW